MTIGVYKIVNKITGECYVGASIDVERRIKHHTTKPNKKLAKAFRKYGIANFEYIILEVCNQNNLSQREQDYIGDIKPTYNTLGLTSPLPKSPGNKRYFWHLVPWTRRTG